MPNFKKYNYQQDAMVVINFEKQLQPKTFEYTLHHLIDHHINLSAFYDQYANDEGGRSAYDPAILLKIILFAYSKGMTSSRDIQWQCENNIIFKALSCDSVPHFTSISNFVSNYPDAIESVFEQVLLVCEQQCLLGNELLRLMAAKCHPMHRRGILVPVKSWHKNRKNCVNVSNNVCENIKNWMVDALLKAKIKSDWPRRRKHWRNILTK